MKRVLLPPGRKRTLGRWLFCAVLLGPIFVSATAFSQPAIEERQLENSVVKIFVNTDPPNFLRPWTTHGIGFRTGSGSIIEGRHILTSAHVVSDHTFIQVKKHGDPRRYTADVEAIGHDCDLALLNVKDPRFFENVEPIELGSLPSLKDNVTVIGYPIGGEKLSITNGVVSRIETTSYTHSFKKLLAVQIDAPINPGNSGGPVILDTKMVGVAFQGLKPAQNIGYMVPTPVIRHFFEDLEDGRYDGFPTLGIVAQETENEVLREYYGLDERNEEGGVLITAVLPGTRPAEYLRAGDILIEIDGIPIARDGTIPLRKRERASFAYLISKKQIGEEVALTLIRNGSEIRLSFPAESYVPLVQRPYEYKEPVYYIYGGLVFTVLSMDLLKRGLGNEMKSLFDLHYYVGGPGQLRPKGRQDLAVLVNVLPDRANAGYHGMNLHVIERVNGQLIRSFKGLVLALHHARGPYVRITTEQNSAILMKTEGIEGVNRRILDKYHIPAQYSENVGRWLAEEAPVH